MRLKRMSPWIVRFFLAAFVGLAVACGGSGQAVLSGEALEGEARAIDKLLICPVCPGQTIDQSNVQLARDMRDLVREKLAEEWTRSEILDYFADPDRFGPMVLASPVKSGFNLLAWLLPLGGLVGAALLLYFVLRAMATRPEPPVDESGAGLEPYIERVERELGVSYHQGPATENPSQGGMTSSQEGPGSDG